MVRHIPRLVSLVLATGLAVGSAATGRVAAQPAVPDWVTSAKPSYAMGLWKPRHPVLNEVPSCSPAFHDSFFVIGPDGQRYPTWHPPLAVDPATGAECAFGHEHGRDPRGSQLWKTRQVQRAFYFDANVNGRMDPDEEAWAGLPFGYANSQSDVWFTEQKITTMRHEDHNGHKVEWANDETDIKTHVMSQVKDAGVWIGKNGDDGVVKADTGMRCFFLGKVHQGVSTPDAFRHNLHEVMFFQDCRHKDDLARCVDAHDLSTCPDTNSKNARVSLTTLHPFGASGGFTSFAPLCGEGRRLDPADRIAAGHSTYSPAYPAGHGDREIPTRACVERGFLVEQGFSGNPYEAWPASLGVRPARGQALVEGPDLLFDVNDSVRYYYPEALKARRGYAERHPELAGTDLGYMQDVCSESLDSRRAKHSLCDSSAGDPADISWDDPRAGFKGLNRGMYFKAVILRNAPGPTVWYTDPFGGRASKTPFPGSLRQELSARDVNYSDLIRSAPIDPRVAMRVHDDGRRTVHAPN